MRNGATLYLDLLLDRLLRFWILGRLDKEHRLSLQAESALQQIITPALAIDDGAFNFVMEALRGFFIQHYIAGASLWAVPVGLVQELEPMLEGPLGVRQMDEPHWRTANTTLWTIGTILAEVPGTEPGTRTDISAARALATYARYVLSQALRFRASQARAECPTEAPEALNKRVAATCESLFKELERVGAATAVGWDILNREKYHRKAALFAELVDSSKVLESLGITDA
jgi:hypothetical protein